MLYVVLIPAPLWLALLMATLGPFAQRLRVRAGLRGRWANALLMTMAMQAVLASASALATSNDPIGRWACWLGYPGVLIALLLAVESAVFFVLTARGWPRDATGGRDRFAGAAGLWLAFTVVALLAHGRSVTLCTV